MFAESELLICHQKALAGSVQDAFSVRTRAYVLLSSKSYLFGKENDTVNAMTNCNASECYLQYNVSDATECMINQKQLVKSELTDAYSIGIY